MTPLVHLIFSVLLGTALYKYYSYQAIVAVILGGVFIDIDHYFWYVWQKKSLDFFRAYRYYSHDYLRLGMAKYIKSEIYIFHNIEFLALLIVFSFFSSFAFLFLLGALVHYLLDWIHERKVLPNGLGKSRSFVAWLIRTRRLIRARKNQDKEITTKSGKKG